VRVSHSRVKTWNRCHKQYEYKYVEKLRPKKKNRNLELGSWVHELLMLWRDGEDWKSRHKEFTAEFMDYFEEEREDLGDLPNDVMRIMRSYVRQYGIKDRKDFVVIDTELDEIITLPSGLEINVVIDLIVEDRRGGLWGWDYKTRTQFDPKDLILLDPQYSIYYKAMEVMGYNKMMGFVVDEIRKKAPTVPKSLARGGLSRAKNIDTDVWTYMAAIREHGYNPDHYADILSHIATNQRERFFRRTYLPKDPPVLKRITREVIQASREMQNTKIYTRSVDKSCVWGCDYRDLCIVDLHGGDSSTMKKMNYTKRTDGS
jgi:PD-(D/E)XK nuclease superfamily protein